MTRLIVIFIGLLACANAAAAQPLTPVPGVPGAIPPPPLPPQAIAPPQPGAPAKIDSFGDRAARCVHHGTSFGVPAGRIGQYTRECAQGN